MYHITLYYTILLEFHYIIIYGIVEFILLLQSTI